jgi:hypothetical protein
VGGKRESLSAARQAITRLPQRLIPRPFEGDRIPVIPAQAGIHEEESGGQLAGFVVTLVFTQTRYEIAPADSPRSRHRDLGKVTIHRRSSLKTPSAQLAIYGTRYFHWTVVRWRAGSELFARSEPPKHHAPAQC